MKMHFLNILKILFFIFTELIAILVPSLVDIFGETVATHPRQQICNKPSGSVNLKLKFFKLSIFSQFVELNKNKYFWEGDRLETHMFIACIDDPTFTMECRGRAV